MKLLIINLITGLACAAITQYAFIFQSFKYPPLVACLLFTAAGFFLNRISRDRINRHTIFLTTCWSIIILQIYGLFINYDSLCYLSPSLILIVTASFYAGYLFSKQRAKTLIPVITIAALSLFLGLFLLPRLSFQQRITKLSKPLPLTNSLIDQDSLPVNINAIRDKVIVLNFWNSGCGYCFQKMPYITKLAQQLDPEKTTFYEINTGDPDSFTAFNKLRKEEKISPDIHAMYDVQSKLAKSLQIDGVPVQVIIKNNRVLHQSVGFTKDDQLLYVDYYADLIAAMW